MNEKTKKQLFAHKNVTADSIVYVPEKEITLTLLDSVIKNLSSDWEASILGETQKKYNVPAATSKGFAGNRELAYYALSVEVSFSKKNVIKKQYVHLRLEGPKNRVGGWTRVVFWSPNRNTINVINGFDTVIEKK
jgi:hypothetical protein